MSSPRRFALAALLALPLAGCITAYEPATGAPPLIPSRTARPAEPAPAPAITRLATTQVPAALRQPQPLPRAPETPAGRQLSWLIRTLGSGDTRNIEMRFAPRFLEQAPVAQLERLIHEWRRDELGPGPVQLAQLEDDETPESLIAFIRGITGRYSQVRLTVDEEGRIAGLLLAPAPAFRPGVVETWGRLDDQLAALPGRIAFAAYELDGARVDGSAAPARADDGRRAGEPMLTPIHTINATDQFNIGSTFKLYILGALAERIAEGRAAWTDEIQIIDDLKSLPPGQMQIEQEGIIYPVEHFAELMMSVGDNTATDHLIHFLGRDVVESYMMRQHAQPQHNLPFLTTMEFFRLKLGPDRATLLPAYAQANLRTRRAMLAEGGAVAQSTPSLAAAALWRAPFHIDEPGVGWFASSQDLARIMGDLHRLERMEGMEPLGRILRTNPGLPFDRAAWTSIAYKGGSEPGALNMTWLLQRADDRWFVLTLTWNDTRRPVELRRAADLAAAAANLLAAEGMQ